MTIIMIKNNNNTALFIKTPNLSSILHLHHALNLLGKTSSQTLINWSLQLAFTMQNNPNSHHTSSVVRNDTS